MDCGEWLLTLSWQRACCVLRSAPLHSVVSLCVVGNTKTIAYVAQVFDVAFLLDDSTVQHFLPNWVYDDCLRFGIPHAEQWRT